MHNLKNSISGFLKNYILKSKLKCFVIGISGGIDSATVSTLCARTGIETVVVSMPILQNKEQLIRADNHIKWLKENFNNVKSYTYDLTNLFNNFKKLFEIENTHALANSRSRLRMIPLYQVAGINNGLVVGTGNKVEDFGVGFFTKYGDGGVDISPLADINKTGVRRLAKDLNINDEIITARPTDGLWDDDRSDEDQIGATYEELEWAMEYEGNLIDLTDRQKQVLEIYNNFNRLNAHKMNPIPVFKL
jgi:NAD+ synthase